jgi:hypothetical protein
MAERRDQKTTSPPRINLQNFATSKIREVLRRKALDKTNYQEPDDTCECSDFVTSTPAPPSNPRRVSDPRPPRPPRPPVLPPPLPPPPTRFTAPQLPSVIPPIIAPPPIIFPDPDIDIEVDDPGGGDGGDEGTTTADPGDSTTVVPPSGDGGGGLWSEHIPCCNSSTSGNGTGVTDGQLSLEVEQNTHSGEFRNGCYPVCTGQFITDLESVGGEAPGFCKRNSIQICKCVARNIPSNPCYQENGLIDPPGGNLTTAAMMKKIVLPAQYNTPSAYYLANVIST